MTRLPEAKAAPGNLQPGFIGWLTQVQNANSTGGPLYAFAYSYNPAGGMTSMQYPTTGMTAGVVVNYAYDGAGRPLSVQEANRGTTMYATGIQYAPQGAPTNMTFGNQLVESRQYNSLLQTTQIQAGSNLTLNYTYSPTQNNGNLQAQQIQAGSLNVTQNYGYDTVNRLLTASEGSNWQQSYVYDAFGNRAVLAGVPPVYIPGNTQTPQVSTSSAAAVQALFPSNRYTGCQYDNGNTNGPGNATSCAGLAAGTLAFDSDNHLTSAGGTTYAYDGNGNRVLKTTSAGSTWYLYGADGTVAAEYATAATASATQYLTVDALGSTRLVTGASGCSRHDFLPFGEEIDPSIGSRGQQDPCYSNGATDGVTQKFTGQERDDETGMDNFLARHFGSAQGRFMSPDPAGLAAADPANPQSWNQYSYVLNNSLMFVDPSGLGPTCVADGASIPCGLVNAESSISCPGGDCSRVRQDPKTGNLQYLLWSSKFVSGTPRMAVDENGVERITFPGVETLTYTWITDYLNALGGENSFSNVVGRVNRCASAQSSNYLNPWPGNFLTEALLGNEAASWSQLALGPGRGRTAAELAVNNSAEKSSLLALAQRAVGKTGVGSRPIIGYSMQEVAAPTVSFGTKTVAQSALGKALFKGIALFTGGKAVVDVGWYIGALQVCSQ
jgi:RHS repeat-associated protein